MTMRPVPALFLAAIFINADIPEKYNANAQGLEVAATIGADQLMNGVIDKAHTALVSIIEKLDDSIGSATFLTKMQLTNLLSELDFRSKEVVGKTFSEMNNTQKVFFSNLVLTISDLSALADHVADNADGVLKRSQTILAMVPFTEKEPRLLSQNPKIVLDRDVFSAKRVEISFGGSFLAHEAPQFIMENNRCDLKSSSDFELKFSCAIPENWFGSPVSTQYIRHLGGTLGIALEENFWKKLASLFHSDNKYKNYTVDLSVVPDRFGTFTTSLVQQNVVNVSQDRSGQFDSGAKHCVSGSSAIANFSPSSAGWQVDVNSIKIVPKSCNNGGAAAINVTAGGFQVKAWGNNSGTCGPFGIGKDARGWCNGDISWKEFRSQVAPAELSIPAKEVHWGERIVSLLPDHAAKVITTVRMFDGKVREYEQSGGNEFFKYTISPDNSSVSIEPKQLADAFK